MHTFASISHGNTIKYNHRAGTPPGPASVALTESQARDRGGSVYDLWPIKSFSDFNLERGERTFLTGLCGEFFFINFFLLL